MTQTNMRDWSRQTDKPVRIKAVQDRTLKVQHTLGGRKDFRIVPKSKVQRLVNGVPESLVAQTYQSLGYDPPERSKALAALCFKAPEDPSDSVASEQQSGNTENADGGAQRAVELRKEPHKGKRRRTILLE
eukprot:GHVS01100813.1.p1 GENE.GHVS01100813.1~~GHVS01100813.1.p1  ORF type:complete len:131 (+),score=14.71 GHVS01100813.1:182-574(+)